MTNYKVHPAPPAGAAPNIKGSFARRFAQSLWHPGVGNRAGGRPWGGPGFAFQTLGKTRPKTEKKRFLRLWLWSSLQPVRHPGGCRTRYSNLFGTPGAGAERDTVGGVGGSNPPAAPLVACMQAGVLCVYFIICCRILIPLCLFSFATPHELKLCAYMSTRAPFAAKAPHSQASVSTPGCKAPNTWAGQVWSCEPVYALHTYGVHDTPGLPYNVNNVFPWVSNAARKGPMKDIPTPSAAEVAPY